jgi:hypothetical protein
MRAWLQRRGRRLIERERRVRYDEVVNLLSQTGLWLAFFSAFHSWMLVVPSSSSFTTDRVPSKTCDNLHDLLLRTYYPVPSQICLDLRQLLPRTY